MSHDHWERTTVDLGEGALQRLSIKPMDIILAAGRMSRDGKTLDQIRAALDIPRAILVRGGREGVSDMELERFLAVARLEFAKAVAEGNEPAESTVVIDPDLAELLADDDDG